MRIEPQADQGSVRLTIQVPKSGTARWQPGEIDPLLGLAAMPLAMDDDEAAPLTITLTEDPGRTETERRAVEELRARLGDEDGADEQAGIATEMTEAALDAEKLARKAEKMARAHSSRFPEDEKEPSKSPPRRSPPRRRRSSNDGSKSPASLPSSRKPSRANIVDGLEGRDADEAEQLDRIRRKDDTINAGLDEIDSMLDALGGDARRMNAQVRRQNSRLGVMNEALEESEARTARVNARARHNVGYYGRPDL